MSDTIIVNGVEYIKKYDDSMPYVIVRTYSAGVFAGNIKERNGKEVVLKNARRIWYWEGAASLSQLAQSGTTKPEKCKFPTPVEEILLTEVIEILRTSKIAESSIKSVPMWSIL